MSSCQHPVDCCAHCWKRKEKLAKIASGVSTLFPLGVSPHGFCFQAYAVDDDVADIVRDDEEYELDGQSVP